MVRSHSRATSRLKAGGAVAVLVVSLVGGWEGLRLYSYPDVINVWTACYGSTKGIKPGMKFTKEQCDTLLIADLEEHEAGMRRCTREPDQIPEKTYVALLSFTFNVGVGNYCGSTLRRMVDAGRYRAACEELDRWTRAGGKVVRGLVNRRAAEKKLCLEGLA